MTRSASRWAAAAALHLMGVTFALAEGTNVAPKVGMFTISLRSSFNPIPKHLQLMDFWFPMPFDDEHQKIYQRFISAPYEIELNELPDKAGVVAYMKGAPRGGLPMQVRVTFHVERLEDLRNSFQPPKEKPAQEAEKQIRERWLASDRMVTIDREVRSIASRITSGKRKPLDKARAIYDHLLADMDLLHNVYEVQGAGYGNLKFALRQKKGDSVDLASVFVGLCRAEEIPARTVIGLKVPRGKEGSINGYHSWAEFYLEGVGWVPVDPAEAKLNPARKAYYFGALDERRVAISVGRDILLAPPQVGAPLNYFINPYWEGDQKEMPTPWVEAEFTELTEIPGKPNLPTMPATKPPPTPPAGSQPQPSSPPQKPPR